MMHDTGWVKYISQKLYKYLKGFGFGELTGVLLPGEQAGLLRDVNNWSAQSIKLYQ
jgi:cell division protein FtsI/penicillin-binding protein 2